jgi:hypothetical protein
MATIYPMTQSFFVNKQAESPAQQAVVKDSAENKKETTNNVQKAKPVEGEFIKVGDAVSFNQAEDLFENAKKYVEMTKNAQQGLQAYTSLDTDTKRDKLHNLMGVDLYA